MVRRLVRVCGGMQRDGGITAEAFMKKIGVSLDKVAFAILIALDEGVPPEINAIAVTPAGIEHSHELRAVELQRLNAYHAFFG
jgi:hypothetical protein